MLLSGSVNINVTDRLNSIAGNSGFTLIDNLGSFTSNVVSLFLTIASIASFVFFAWGGLQWILAGSDKGKVEEARARLTNAIIGLAVVAASWAIFLLLNYFFGLGLVGDAASTNTNTNTSTSTNTTTGCSRGVCVATSKCVSGPPPADAYCQNDLYMPLAAGGCTTSTNQPGVCCDCIPR